jgi:hypothetical protein
MVYERCSRTDPLVARAFSGARASFDVQGVSTTADLPGMRLSESFVLFDAAVFLVSEGFVSARCKSPWPCSQRSRTRERSKRDPLFGSSSARVCEETNHYYCGHEQRRLCRSQKKGASSTTWRRQQGPKFPSSSMRIQGHVTVLTRPR